MQHVSACTLEYSKLTLAKTKKEPRAPGIKIPWRAGLVGFEII